MTAATAKKLILKERQRQVEEEGYEAIHDDSHTQGELSIAAACYQQAARENSPTISSWWPWDYSYWKPFQPGTRQVDRRRCLVKAGALILAEQERLNRVLLNIVTQLKNIES